MEEVVQEAAEFAVSLEILDQMPSVVAGGMVVSTLVVSAVSAFTCGFKALLKMIGR